MLSLSKHRRVYVVRQAFARCIGLWRSAASRMRDETLPNVPRTGINCSRFYCKLELLDLVRRNRRFFFTPARKIHQRHHMEEQCVTSVLLSIQMKLGTSSIQPVFDVYKVRIKLTSRTPNVMPEVKTRVLNA